MKIGHFGQLIFTENADIFNNEQSRLISIFEDARGNPMFRSPDVGSNFRVDYVMAMLFLNNGEFIDDLKDYFVKHIDGDPKNCRLENLELITDPDEVYELRFSRLRGLPHKFRERKVLPFYVADKNTLGIEVYSLNEVCAKYNLTPAVVIRKAKNNENIYPGKYDLFLCETMYDAWLCL